MIQAVPSPHERFYFTDGNLRLQVEDTLYLVHRYLFTTHARSFMSALSNVDPYTLPIKPYILNDIKRTDFDRLLFCLYPRELMVEEPRSSEEWISILKLASKWEFQSLQKRAISELDNIATPIEKVTLGREYDIPELRLPAYVDLCKSNIPLTEEDGERLGLQDVIKIYRVRQELWGQDINPISPEDILAKVRTHFLPLRPSPPIPPARSDPSPPPQVPVRSLSPTPSSQSDPSPPPQVPVRLPSPPPSHSDPSPLPQMPVRPPSPPPLNWPPSPQLIAGKDSRKDLVVTGPDKSSFLEAVDPVPPADSNTGAPVLFSGSPSFMNSSAISGKLGSFGFGFGSRGSGTVDERKRTPSPATSVEVHPTTPLLSQPTRIISSVPPERKKLDWTAIARPETPTPTTILPSAQAGPSASPKPKKQKQAQPPPNPPGTGKKSKKKAAAMAALAAQPTMNGNAYSYL